MIENADLKNIGSSPRVWGHQANPYRSNWEERFIPTGVGTSFKHGDDRTAHEVHPHGCGDIRIQDDLGSSFRGSSPRVWGHPNREGFVGDGQ